MIGIYTIEDLKKHNIQKMNGKGGIYLWGVKHNDRYIPIYVGSHGNIHEGIFQHLCHWRGGEYRVPLWNDIISFHQNTTPFAKDNNLLYIPKGPLVFKDFLTNTDIQYTIQKVLDNFFCCWDIFPDNNHKAADEEDAFATLIKKEILISSHRKSDTPETLFSRKFYDDFQNHKTVII